MKTKNYITLQEHNARINQYNLIRSRGIKPTIKKNYFRIIAGCGIIGISLLTPFTNWFLIPIGLFIIGVSLRDVEELKRKIKNKIKGFN